MIKSKREEKKMTQAELAEILGIERSTIAKWETGKAMPRVAILKKIAEVLECTVDELIA